MSFLSGRARVVRGKATQCAKHRPQCECAQWTTFFYFVFIQLDWFRQINGKLRI